MTSLTQALWVLLLGSLLGLELIGKVPPTLHTPLMSGANAISGITLLASLALIQQEAGHPLLTGSTAVVKTGAGTLVLDQANTLTGSTVVQAGVLRLAHAAALESSRLVVVAGGTAQVAPLVITSVAALDLATGSGLLDVSGGGLTITACTDDALGRSRAQIATTPAAVDFGEVGADRKFDPSHCFRLPFRAACREG